MYSLVWPISPSPVALGLPSVDVHGNELKPNLWVLSVQLTGSSVPAHLPEILHIKEVKGLKELTPLEAKLLIAGRQEGANILEAQELWRDQ